MKKLIALLLALTMVLALTACGSSSNTPSTSAPAASSEASGEVAGTEALAVEDHTYDVEYWSNLSSNDIVSWNAPNNYKKIGLIVPDTTTEFYNGIMQDVIAICNEAGYECVADGINSDVTRGITAIETWVAQGIDAIIIMAQDQSCDLALKKAMEAGVLVVSASAEVQYYHHWLMQDNYDVGYQTGVMAANWMKDKGYENGQYILIANNMNEAVTDKSTGVREAMLAELPEGACVGEVVFTSMDQVRADVDTLLMQYPDVKCIASMHNAFAMIGLEAAKASGKAVYGEFAVFGASLSEQVLSEFAKEDSCYEGEIWCGDQGRSMAEHTIALLEGESFTRDWAALNFPMGRWNLDTYYEDYYAQLNG